ncbi:MAG: amidohydrolase family protein [Burkholderiales bacterium]
MPYSGPIIDAHHHIWRLADVPWLAGPILPRIFGDYTPIKRDYLVDEYLRDVRAAGVEQSVYVQCNWPNDRAIDEVAWVQSVSDQHGFPHGIVGFADLADPAIAKTLDGELAFKGFRGVRQQLHCHEKPLYKFAERSDLFDDSAWRAGLREVERRGLLFELQVFASQMEGAAKLARDFPKMTFVLMHAGMLEDRSPAGLAAWRKGLREMAACPNVVTKLSGLGTFVRRTSVDLWQPMVDEAIAQFGPKRCIFGSNFPIEKLWTSYAELVGVMRTLLARLPEADQRDIFYGNAKRIYRLD